MLQTLIDKYSVHPEFLGMDLTDPNQQGYLDDTLLHIVARVGTVEEINLLVASEAHINAIGDIGYTPLHYAVMLERREIIKKLLDLGADPNIQNEFGETAIDVADNRGHTEIAAFIRNFNK